MYRLEVLTEGNKQASAAVVARGACGAKTTLSGTFWLLFGHENVTENARRNVRNTPTTPHAVNKVNIYKKSKGTKNYAR